MLSVLLYSILSVQIVYSVQLNCTDSKYTETAAKCSAAQQIYCTITVQTLQSATEIYLPQLLSSCSYIFSSTTGDKI